MPKQLSSLASAVRASTTLAIDSQYKKMLADGIDVIGFGAGEPDFDTPDNIKDAAIDAIHKNFTRYTPSSGIEELRRAVCGRIAADCGVTYTPAQVVVSNGAKQCLYLALAALCDPGDEVILQAPYWVSYYELIKMVGAVPVVVDTGEATGWKLTADMLRGAVTDRTKAFILNSPSNPSGVVYTAEELRAIGEVCVEKDVYVIADEIYYKLVYDGLRFQSFPALSEEIKRITVLINGVSKSYAMTGWRIGYLLAEPEVARVAGNFQSHASSNPNSIAQKAALAGLSGEQGGIEDMRRAFEQRRDYFLSRAERIPGVKCIRPEGAFYVMMDVSEYFGRTLHGIKINNADDFGTAFLEKGLVAVVPCTGFGAPNHIRWSYATSMQNIKEGLDRLEAFLTK
ncbi:MAG: pyridoxal phosphate-dependent aminotransferase [Oscillospiraceae bacterium]|jgi:aspartate aminotransferase|nr:pyridoxal phosphate-dependent aminotransferase [Oscillospiraceae bacterium]